MHDYHKLCKKLGKEKVKQLSPADLFTCCNLVGLCKVNNINEIRISDKKEILETTEMCPTEAFRVEDQKEASNE